MNTRGFGRFGPKKPVFGATFWEENHVFQRDDNGTPEDPSDDSWVEDTKLSPLHPQANEAFGYSVAIDGNWIVVGSPYCNQATSDQGRIYISERQGTTWEFAGGYTSDASHLWGFSVAVSGEVPDDPVLAVGAPGSDTVSVLRKYQGGSFYGPPFAASDTDSGDDFGYSVALSGDLLIVGAPDQDPTPGADSGVAYVFRETGWLDYVEEARLVPSDIDDDDYFA